jgi:hypothetical protein
MIPENQHLGQPPKSSTHWLICKKINWLNLTIWNPTEQLQNTQPLEQKPFASGTLWSLCDAPYYSLLLQEPSLTKQATTFLTKRGCHPSSAEAASISWIAVKRSCYSLAWLLLPSYRCDSWSFRNTYQSKWSIGLQLFSEFELTNAFSLIPQEDLVIPWAFLISWFGL